MTKQIIMSAQCESILFLEFFICKIRNDEAIIMSLLSEVPKKSQDYNIVSEKLIKNSDDDISSFGLLYYLIIANSNKYTKIKRKSKL